MDITIKKDVFSDLIWMSTRYCIGRHTIAAAHHAYNLIPLCKYLSHDERIQLMLDIRNKINDILLWKDDVHNYGTDCDLFTSLCKLYSDNYAFIINNFNIHYYLDFYENEFKVESGSECKSFWRSTYIDLYPWHRLQKYLSNERYIIEKNNIQHECFSVMYSHDNTYTEIYCPVDSYEKNPFITTFIDEYDRKHKI